MYVVRISEATTKFITDVVDYSYVSKPEDQGKFFLFGTDLTSEVLSAEQMDERFGPPRTREVTVYEIDSRQEHVL